MNSNGIQATNQSKKTKRKSNYHNWRKELSETLEKLKNQEQELEQLRDLKTGFSEFMERTHQQMEFMVNDHCRVLNILEEKDRMYESQKKEYLDAWWDLANEKNILETQNKELKKKMKMIYVEGTQSLLVDLFVIKGKLTQANDQINELSKSLKILEEKEHIIEFLKKEQTGYPQTGTLEYLEQNAQDLKLIKDENYEVLKSLEDKDRECESLKNQYLHFLLHLINERDILGAQVKELKKELEIIKKKQVRTTKDKYVQTQVLIQKIVSVPPCNFQIKISDEKPFREEMGKGQQKGEKLERKETMMLSDMVLLCIPLFVFLFLVFLFNQ